MKRFVALGLVSCLLLGGSASAWAEESIAAGEAGTAVLSEECVDTGIETGELAADEENSIIAVNEEQDAKDALAAETELSEDSSDDSVITEAADTEGEELLGASTVNMYRLYNPNSGEHFYTGNANERDNLVRFGWSYEGTGWVAPTKNSAPVYRLYNPNAGDHHYTTNSGEKNNLVRLGWKYEGIGWYSDTSKRVKVYRQYNPKAKTGTHNYTTSKAENDMLVRAGWKAEGIGWYAVKAGNPLSPASRIVFKRSYNSSYESAVITAYSADNRVLWIRRTGSYPGTQLSNTGEITQDGTTYYYYEGGAVYAIDKTSGKVRWKTDSVVGGSVHGVAMNGMLYCGGGLNMEFVAINAGSGQVAVKLNLTDKYMWNHSWEPATYGGNTGIRMKATVKDRYMSDCVLFVNTYDFSTTRIG